MGIKNIVKGSLISLSYTTQLFFSLLFKFFSIIRFI